MSMSETEIAALFGIELDTQFRPDKYFEYDSFAWRIVYHLQCRPTTLNVAGAHRCPSQYPSYLRAVIKYALQEYHRPSPIPPAWSDCWRQK